jgi:hypothetical protein
MIPHMPYAMFPGNHALWFLFVQGCVQGCVHDTLHMNFPLYISIYPFCVRSVIANEDDVENKLYGYRTPAHPAHPAQLAILSDVTLTHHPAFAGAVSGAALHCTHGGRG